MSRITRKELKTDKFALEVEHGISFFEHHKNEAVKYGAIAIGVIVLIVGYTIYSRGQHSNREQALAAAIRVQEAPVGVSGNGGPAFPSQEAKDQETIRVFTELQTKYSGSAEGEIAQYYLGSIKADQGKLAEAEKLVPGSGAEGRRKVCFAGQILPGADLLCRRPRGPGRKTAARSDRAPDGFRLRGPGDHLAGSLPGAKESRRGTQAAGPIAQPAGQRRTNGAHRCCPNCRRSSRRPSCWRGCDFR